MLVASLSPRLGWPRGSPVVKGRTTLAQVVQTRWVVQQRAPFVVVCCGGGAGIAQWAATNTKQAEQLNQPLYPTPLPIT